MKKFRGLTQPRKSRMSKKVSKMLLLKKKHAFFIKIPQIDLFEKKQKKNEICETKKRIKKTVLKKLYNNGSQNVRPNLVSRAWVMS